MRLYKLSLFQPQKKEEEEEEDAHCLVWHGSARMQSVGVKWYDISQTLGFVIAE